MKISVLALIALLCILAIVSAKEYTVMADNWRVTFDTNDTIYTKNEWIEPKNSGDVGYYTIWANEDPGLTTRSSAIILYNYDLDIPIGEAWMSQYVSGLLSPFNKTYSLLNYRIDGKNGIAGEGYADQFGRVVYSAIYPLDITTDNTATKFVGFLSLLNRTISYEILDSLHVEYLESSTATTSSRFAKLGGASTVGTDIFNSPPSQEQDRYSSEGSPDPGDTGHTFYEHNTGSSYYGNTGGSYAGSSDGPFVGSSKSDKYHYPSCSAAQRIKPGNLVTFSNSADARVSGYSPCGICHPP